MKRVCTSASGNFRSAHRPQYYANNTDFESMVEGLIVLGDQNRIERVNRALVEMTGYPVETRVKKTTLEAFRNASLHQALERFNQTHEPLLVEIIPGRE